ncbi:MAG: SDR family oxidoreductase [Ruminococcus sp.]|nr:SDR family oxidoreductase [Ruminococcus sp.]
MEKWAVITGASSGIGREFARFYASRGYNLVIAARREDKLVELAQSLDVRVRIIVANLAEKGFCVFLHESMEDLNVELLINCAGFGEAGSFDKADPDRLADMTSLNCTSLMYLTNLFLKDFKAKDKGTIINVASSAGLMPGGPNMAVYYATKAYVVSLTNAIHEELRAAHSSVRIAALCPGPVDTEFNDVAGVNFAIKQITPQYCVKAAALGLDKGERIIIPEEHMKVLSIISRIAPQSIVLAITGHIQKKKL